MGKTPNKNLIDACCRCGRILTTQGADKAVLDSSTSDDQLLIHQPAATDPPQWICGKCAKELAAE